MAGAREMSPLERPVTRRRSGNWVKRGQAGAYADCERGWWNEAVYFLVLVSERRALPADRERTTMVRHPTFPRATSRTLRRASRYQQEGTNVMPILPAEPNIFPDDLFCKAQAPPDALQRWWVLRTPPRAEKTLSRTCLSRGLPFFLPLCQRRTRSRGRTLTSHVPLFPGYLFLFADDEARVEALTTNLVVNCLPVSDQAELHADLSGIHRLMTAEMPVAQEERLSPGTLVEIVRGPLAGLQGKVIEQGKNLRFVVEVHFLQKGAWVKIEGWMLEKVS